MSEQIAPTEFTPSHRGGEGPPLVLLHGFTDTWRGWEPVLPALEQRFDVLAPTLAGHAGGPPLEGTELEVAIVDAAERALDEAGLETANLVGNSLGGFVALSLAARGRATTVTALAPAGGWPAEDPAIAEVFEFFQTAQQMLAQALPHVDALVATPEGRAMATQAFASTAEHMSEDLVRHQILGASRSEAGRLMEYGRDYGWTLDAERIGCPVRLVWGTADQVLVLPTAAARFRDEWLPQAEWIELEGAGHCPQLDHPTETAQLIADFAR